MSIKEKPWVPVSEVFDHFGYKNQKSALAAITAGTFPVATFRIGRIRAIHREVYDTYFGHFRDKGLAEMLDGAN